MNLRNATLHDLPDIVAIYNSTVPGRMVTADTEPVSVESRKAWFDAHNSATRPLWIVETEYGTAGFVSFKSFYGRPAYQATAEISIYLDENFRGLGLGKLVLKECVTRSPALGIKTLLAFIFGHNEPSLKLFTNAGFGQWGFFPGVAELDAIVRDLAILGRKV